MYADDLLLMSPSINELQLMLTVCENELALLDLKLNATKSVCLRIGQRHNKNCFTLHSQAGPIPWVSEARYLGLYLVSGRKFSCSLDNRKAKFDRSSNAILGKLGKNREILQ